MARKVVIRISACCLVAKSCDARITLVKSFVIQDTVHLAWRLHLMNCLVRAGELLYLHRFLVGHHCHLVNSRAQYLRFAAMKQPICVILEIVRLAQ